MHAKVCRMESRMKKTIVIWMVLILITLSFVGCSKQKKDKAESVTITIWHDKEDEVANVMQTALDTLAPEIIVKLEKKNGLTDALKMVGNDKNAAPDLYFFAHDKIGVYAEMGILAPITDFLGEETLNQYLDNTLAAASYQGTLYQLPIYYETLLFMYNKALMTEAEVPTTTEDLYSYMQAHTANGSYGFVEQHSTAYYSVPWIHGFGGSLIDETGNSKLDSIEVNKALQYHKKFLEFMPGESEYSTVNTLFLEGFANSTIGGPWLVPTAREAGIDLGFAAMPTVNETGIPLSPYSGVQGVHVLKVAAVDKKEAVTKVLECLSNPQVGIDMARVSGCAPANSLSYEDPEIAQDQMIMMMKQTAESAIPMPNIPEMDVMFVVTGNLLVSVNMKDEDVTAATKSAQEKAIALINAMK